MINARTDSSSNTTDTSSDDDNLQSASTSIIKKAPGTRGRPKGSKSKQTASGSKQGRGKKSAQNAQSGDAEKLLKADHRKVEELFESYQEAEESDEKREIAHNICKELMIHTKLEEEIFYPECYAHGVEEDALGEAQVEHDTAKIIIADLLADTPDDEYYDSKVKVLEEYIKHHVAEEEQARSGIFAKARKAGVDMDELGTRIQERKEELLEEMGEDTEDLEPPQPQTLHALIHSDSAYDEDESGEEMGYTGYTGRGDRYSQQTQPSYQSGGQSSRGQSSRHESSRGQSSRDQSSYGQSRGQSYYGDNDDDGRNYGGRQSGRRSDYSEEYGRQGQQSAQSRYSSSQQGSRGRETEHGRYGRDQDEGYGSRGQQYGERGEYSSRGQSRQQSGDDWDSYGRSSRASARSQYDDDEDYGASSSARGGNRSGGDRSRGGSAKSQSSRSRQSR